MTTSSTRGLVLVAHGSPDPSWRENLDAVAARVASLAPSVTVQVAFLERDLPDVEGAVACLVEQGRCTHIRVSVLLLSGGGRHFKVDVPEVLARTRLRFPGVTIDLDAAPVGTHPQVIEAIARVCAGASP